jgi:hypothetical protein
VFHEVGMPGKFVVFAMFEDKDSAIGQQLMIENKVGDSRQFLQCVWRIGKDKVELLMA